MSGARLMKEKYRLIKFMFCLIFGFIISKLIGYPNVMTISITSLLVINADRGQKGSLTYIKRRVGTNLLCAILAFILMKAFSIFIPVPMWIQVIIVSAIIVLIGVSIDAKTPIAPQALTIACGAVIIVTGMVSAPLYFIRRVVLVSIGCCLAWVVDYIIFPRSPLKFGTAVLKDTAPVLAQKLLLLASNGTVDFDAAFLGTMNANVTSAQADINLLKANIENSKFSGHKEEIGRMDKMNALAKKTTEFMQVLLQKKDVLAAQPESFRSNYFTALKQMAEQNAAAVNNHFNAETAPVAAPVEIEIPVENNDQIILVSQLIGYRAALAPLCQ